VRLLIKLVLLGFAIYAVATASPDDKQAMQDGLRSFANSIRDACTRPASPCTAAVDSVRTLIGKARDVASPSAHLEWQRPPLRELDGSPRTSTCCFREGRDQR
jgi:hypothetical protein